jgi:Holliday junction resolvase - archaeal type
MGNKKRGYDWEDKVVKIFIKKGWKAIRLGSPSVHLPDVLAINDQKNMIVAVEAKASKDDKIYVPLAEITRLFSFLEMFGAYRRKEAVLAIKFLKVKGKRCVKSFTGWTAYRKEAFFQQEF